MPSQYFPVSPCRSELIPCVLGVMFTFLRKKIPPYAGTHVKADQPAGRWCGLLGLHGRRGR